MTVGYYSLIQHHEDLARQEGRNVGVVVVCDGRVRAVMVREACDKQLDFARKALLARIAADLGKDPTRRALETFRALEANALQLTPVRAVCIESTIEETCDELLRELVHRPAASGPEPDDDGCIQRSRCTP